MFLPQTGIIFWRPADELKPRVGKFEKIRLEHLIFHFALHGVGIAAAVLGFIWELVWAKCKYGHHT